MSNTATSEQALTPENFEKLNRKIRVLRRELAAVRKTNGMTDSYPWRPIRELGEPELFESYFVRCAIEGCGDKVFEKLATYDGDYLNSTVGWKLDLPFEGKEEVLCYPVAFMPGSLVHGPEAEAKMQHEIERARTAGQPNLIYGSSLSLDDPSPRYGSAITRTQCFILGLMMGAMLIMLLLEFVDLSRMEG